MCLTIKYGNPMPAKELAAIDNQPRWTLIKAAIEPVLRAHKREPDHNSFKQALSALRSTVESSSSGKGSSTSEDVDSSEDGESSPKEFSLPPHVMLGLLKQVEMKPRRETEKDFFQVGRIFEAPLHEEDFMYGESLRPGYAHAHKNDYSISASHYGYVHSKLRKFIVVALHSRHYLAIPMYSHNDAGLDTVPEKNEFVSVDDSRKLLPPVQLSDHQPLRAVMKSGTSVLRNQTTAHISYPVSRRYHLRVRHIGTLDADSERRLVKLFRKFI